MNEEITKRLKHLIKTKGENVSSFSRKIGVAQTTLSSLINRNGDLSSKLLRQIAQAYPDISIGWLISGEGNMYKDYANSQLEIKEKFKEQNMYGEMEEQEKSGFQNRRSFEETGPIGLKIKQLMDSRNIDISTMAKKMNRSKQAIYDILSKQDLNTSILRQISNIFHIPISFFFLELNESQESVEKSNELNENLNKPTITANDKGKIGKQAENIEASLHVTLKGKKNGNGFSLYIDGGKLNIDYK